MADGPERALHEGRVDRLIREGLLERSVDPADRRAMKIPDIIEESVSFPADFGHGPCLRYCWCDMVQLNHTSWASEYES
jgi:hypothetical protein